MGREARTNGDAKKGLGYTPVCQPRQYKQSREHGYITGHKDDPLFGRGKGRVLRGLPPGAKYKSYQGPPARFKTREEAVAYGQKISRGEW
jgi:hypothetical protein